MTPAALLHERPPRLMFAEQPESLHLRGPAASKWDGDEKGPAPFLSKPGLRGRLWGGARHGEGSLRSFSARAIGAVRCRSVPATAWTLQQGSKHAALDSFCLMPACEHRRGQAWNLVVRGATTDMELSDVRTNTSILGNPSAICPVTASKSHNSMPGVKPRMKVQVLCPVAKKQPCNEKANTSGANTAGEIRTIEMLGGGIPRTKAGSPYTSRLIYASDTGR